MEQYNNIINCQIGKTSATVISDDYFPLIGDTILMDASTKWGLTSQWKINTGEINDWVQDGNLHLLKDSKQVVIRDKGELKQTFISKNYASEAEVVKTIYAMEPQSLPYFDILISKDVVRVDEEFTLTIVPDNGYSITSLANAEITLKILLENTDIPVLTFNLGRGSGVSVTTSIPNRCILDIDVDVTDSSTGETIGKHINKFISVVPKLCPKPANTTTGYEVAATYQAYTSYVDLPGTVTFELKLWRNVNNSGLNYAELIIPQGNPNNGQWDAVDISLLPAGTTLVLKRDPLEPNDYPTRLFVKGNTLTALTSANGTPNFTYEAPLVITHDREDIMEWRWRAYGACQFGGNVRNVVIDGYGYNNTGIHMTPFDEKMFNDTCMFMNEGASDIEMYGVDIDKSGFAGVAAKSDPDANRPWYWRESGFEMYVTLHHCTFRNTTGEGIYVGYFDSAQKSGTNSDGQLVTYHAHIVHPKVYRCSFINNGYDSVLINNSTEVEFCYNLLDGCGYRREPSLGSAFSCTMDGKIYNCLVKNNYNVIGVFGPFLGKLEVFNNVLTAGQLCYGLGLAAWSTNIGSEHVDGKTFDIHNNIWKASAIGNVVGDVTFSNHTMNDNIFITEKGDTSLPGYFTGVGNIFLTADLNYEDIDEAIKAADSANYNYQIAYNSFAINSGRYGKSDFDMRGYKNWYIGNFHSGPYMGKYKDENIEDARLSVIEIIINEGETETFVRDVTVQLRYAGTPTEYILSEDPDFTDTEWKTYVEGGTIPFTLSEGFAVKTLYAKMRNANQETRVVSKDIEYKKEPLVVTMLINSGATQTTQPNVTVKFEVTGYYNELTYRISEDPTFDNRVYRPYTPGSEISYTFTDKGDKTIYGELVADNDTPIKVSATISYINNKMIMGGVWLTAALPGFDEINGINKVTRWTPLNYVLNNVNKQPFCKISCVKLSNLNAAAANSLTNVWGNPELNNTKYPDYVFQQTVAMYARQESPREEDPMVFRFSELTPGNYKLRMLNQMNAEGNNWGPDSTVNSWIYINGVKHSFADLGIEDFTTNNTIIELDLIIDDSGVLTLETTTNNRWKSVPFNVIELEYLD